MVGAARRSTRIQKRCATRKQGAVENLWRSCGKEKPRGHRGVVVGSLRSSAVGIDEQVVAIQLAGQRFLLAGAGQEVAEPTAHQQVIGAQRRQ